MQPARRRLHPGVGLAVGQHPDHVRAPQLQAGVADRQHRGAVRRQVHLRVGIAAAGGAAPAGGPVDSADLSAAAVVTVDRDGVVIHPGQAAQRGITRIAPTRLTGAGIPPGHLASLGGDYRSAHDHGGRAGGAVGGPQLLEAARHLAGQARVGRRRRGGPADRRPGIAGPPDQCRGDHHNNRDCRGGQQIALRAAFGFDHAWAVGQLACAAASAGLRRRRRRLFPPPLVPALPFGDAAPVGVSAATPSPSAAGPLLPSG